MPSRSKPHYSRNSGLRLLRFLRMGDASVGFDYFRLLNPTCQQTNEHQILRRGLLRQIIGEAMCFRIANALKCALEDLHKAFLIILAGFSIELAQNEVRVCQTQRATYQVISVELQSCLGTKLVAYGKH